VSYFGVENDPQLIEENKYWNKEENRLPEIPE